MVVLVVVAPFAPKFVQFRLPAEPGLVPLLNDPVIVSSWLICDRRSRVLVRGSAVWYSFHRSLRIGGSECCMHVYKWLNAFMKGDHSPVVRPFTPAGKWSNGVK